jgi:hypothetical protein
MGYRGKLREQEEARRLRAEGKTLLEIAMSLNVAKSSASLWVRDVPFTPSPRRTGAHRRRHPFHDAKVRRIAELNTIGRHMIGVLSDDAFLAAGVALYAGEGSKRDKLVSFANSDPAMIHFFCRWLREFFEIDEARLRGRVYLHEGLDLDAAEDFWSALTEIPRSQFTLALPRGPGRNDSVQQACARLRLCLLRKRGRAPINHGARTSPAIFHRYSGVAQPVEQRPVKPMAAGSSPAPGANSSAAPSAARNRAVTPSRYGVLQGPVDRRHKGRSPPLAGR